MSGQHCASVLHVGEDHIPRSPGLAPRFGGGASKAPHGGRSAQRMEGGIMPTKPEVCLSVAALHLDTSPGALRKLFERALKASDGQTEVHVDGVRARKRRGLWRVEFGSSWTRDGELVRWRSSEKVASELGYSPESLRRALQRSRACGSTRELSLRGYRSTARKLGDRWKLLLNPSTVGHDRGGSPRG